MPRKYRVAVIGRTGQGDYNHGLDIVWAALDNVTVVAVADENDAGRAAAAKRLRAAAAYADYRRMLEKEKPQIVAVAPGWADARRDMIIACARAGASIYTDKPLCQSPAEADEIVTACETHHVKLALALQTSYSPVVRRVKDLIDGGTFGELIEVRARGKEDMRGGGEDYVGHACHLLDLMKRLTGREPRWCFASVTHHGKRAELADLWQGNDGLGPLVGDRIDAVYGLDGGVTALFGSRRPTPAGPGPKAESLRFGLTLWGSKGVVQMTTGGLPPAFFLADPGWFPGKKPAGEWVPVTSAGLGQPEPLKNEGLHTGNVLAVKDLMAAIEEDRPPLVNVHDARATVDATLAVYASHMARGPVELPLTQRGHPLRTR